MVTGNAAKMWRAESWTEKRKISQKEVLDQGLKKVHEGNIRLLSC